MGPLKDAIKFGELFDRLGSIAVLIVVSACFAFMYWQERKENKALQNKILENSLSLQSSIGSFKKTLDLLVQVISARQK